ncbi:MAG: SLBB domain-containing protein [Acidobacteria bacterium]|nr:SLBB domain-containing protein [Acidobacteriota bacterium]
MEDLDIRQLLNRVREGGVVGAGGAGFPTWRKLDCRGRADTLILNGAECEPLLYADYHCQLLYADKILATADRLRSLLGLEQVVLAFKRKRQAVRAAVANVLPEFPKVHIQLLENIYPSGDEHILVYDVTGRIVPQGGIPLQVGVLVQNVQTMVYIHDALRGRPVTHRFVTIGGAVARPYTAEVPIGMRLAELLERAGGVTCRDPHFLAGGVMMGDLVTEDFAVAKTTAGILVLPRDNPAVQERLSSLERDLRIALSVCDQCYACTEMCPRRLIGHEIEPHLLMRRAGTVLHTPGERDHIAHYCCECGICSLIACPVKITPRRLIAAMKAKVPLTFKRELPAYEIHPEFDRKRLPLDYVARRMDVHRYDEDHRFLGQLSDVGPVELALTGFGGRPLRPVVADGDRVIAGERVAHSEDTVLHASIAGRVRLQANDPPTRLRIEP